MKTPLHLRPEAEQDLAESQQWYEGERSGLGHEFLDAVRDQLVHIERSPRMFAVVYRDVRQVKLRRFPHVIHYRALPDRTEVLAVLHGARNPSTWKRRLQDLP